MRGYDQQGALVLSRNDQLPELEDRPKSAPDGKRQTPRQEASGGRSEPCLNGRRSRPAPTAGDAAQEAANHGKRGGAPTPTRTPAYVLNAMAGKLDDKPEAENDNSAAETIAAADAPETDEFAEPAAEGDGFQKLKIVMLAALGEAEYLQSRHQEAKSLGLEFGVSDALVRAQRKRDREEASAGRRTSTHPAASRIRPTGAIGLTLPTKARQRFARK